MGEKGEGFIVTTIKDTWTITRQGGNKGRKWGGWGGGEGKKTVLEKQLKK